MPTYLRPGMGLFSPNRVAATATTRMLRVGLVLIAAFALMGAAAGAAQAAGTITVQKGGTRTATDTDAGYAAALGGASFQYAAYVNDVNLAKLVPAVHRQRQRRQLHRAEPRQRPLPGPRVRGAGRLARIPDAGLGRRLVGPEPDPRLRRRRHRHEQLESHRPPVQRLAVHLRQRQRALHQRQGQPGLPAAVRHGHRARAPPRSGSSTTPPARPTPTRRRRRASSPSSRARPPGSRSSASPRWRRPTRTRSWTSASRLT